MEKNNFVLTKHFFSRKKNQAMHKQPDKWNLAKIEATAPKLRSYFYVSVAPKWDLSHSGNNSRISNEHLHQLYKFLKH